MLRSLLLGLAVLALPRSALAQGADLIITGARIWTGDSARPLAGAIAISGDRIVGVGDESAVQGFISSSTRRLNLTGRFITPGFIDNHTHFGQAGALLLGVNLLDVADEASLVRRVREARDRVPAGAWLVGGDWGAYEAWAQGSSGRQPAAAARAPFSPTRSMIDSVTPNTAALLSKWDRSAYLANGRALHLAGASCAWPGVECSGGQPTGRLTAEAANRVRAAIPPKGMEQKMAEGRVALEQLRG